MSLGLLVTAVFLLSAGSVVGLYFLVSNRSQAALRRTVEDRLQEVSGGGPIPSGTADSLIRSEQAGPLPTVDRVARQAMKGLAFERWLAQSGLGLSISALVLICLVAGAAGAGVALLLSGWLSVAAAGFAAGAGLPLLFVRHKRAARLRRFEEHFPEALDLLSRAVRAGHAFSAGMKMVADEMSEPVGPEFRITFEEQNYGLSLKESLGNLTVRMPLLDVRFFATAVLIQRETGGNLSEILDNLAAVVRERFKIYRQVRVHTAHGRITGYVLLALPMFLAVALSFINPEHMDLLFKDPLGQAMIVVAIVMQATGWFWIKQVVKIEV